MSASNNVSPAPARSLSSSSRADAPARRANKRASLPRLPIPDLQKTVDRYLNSLEPFMLEEDARGGMSYTSARTLRDRWATEFTEGIGATLQERLIALDKASPNNWLDDNFWINKAYLEGRSSLLINSNWWLAFKDDDLIPPAQAEQDAEEGGLFGITPLQIRRAAWITHRVLDFREKLALQEIHPETTKTGIWMQENTRKVFNTTRKPEPYCDVVTSTPFPSENPAARRMNLNVHNWFYAVDVYDDHCRPLPPTRIEANIRSAVADAHARRQAGETAVPVGILSADNRDEWTKNLAHLLSLSPANKETYEAVVDAVMGLSLDTLPTTPVHHHPNTDTPIPFSSTRIKPLDEHLHSIRGTTHNVANRFFDKSFTLIVDPLTRAGAIGEHSPVDALVPSIVAEYGIVEGCPSFDDVQPEAPSSSGFRRLDWVVDDEVERACARAKAHADALIVDSDNMELWFEDYGTDWIKNSAKLSPDAYIQMVLQLAYYRTAGEFSATYETALTRMFKHGRTETIRSYTAEAREWVLAMCANPGERNYVADPRKLRALLDAAVQKHTRLTRLAATGQGIDRHLMGLRLMLRPLNGENVALFEDVLFDKSQQWKLSTSGLSAGLLFNGTGFGAVYPDGYGINYLAAPDMIKFGIESKHSCPTTSTEGFRLAVIDALRDVKALCSADTPNDIPHSRL
ncbi:acyltransferase ChoActase/COT/CPT [Schizophyllum commune Loenen D]|nr:acyltransferase ChoActase/COT/CPT [Schizophyllum commune Loenen D]